MMYSVTLRYVLLCRVTLCCAMRYVMLSKLFRVVYYLVVFQTLNIYL